MTPVEIQSQESKVKSQELDIGIPCQDDNSRTSVPRFAKFSQCKDPDSRMTPTGVNGQGHRDVILETFVDSGQKIYNE